MAEDRRVRKSKAAIKKAFIHLLEDSQIERITIRQISDKADINRGTFYLNYDDKYALLEEMEDEQIADLKKLVDIRKVNLAQKTAEEFIEIFSNEVIKKVIIHISENIEFYHAILNLDRTSKIEERITDMILSNINYLIGENNTVYGVPDDYYLRYVSGALMSMVKYWVHDENRVSIEELVQYIVTISTRGPLSILKQLIDSKK
ncbi:TetR/AcrR family transcriptional regulator [Staphylococcus lentus]|uniref:TetR family transcriptional regulator C-terminal domain-containing protein n=2 Tax=Mammaliicoccus lentus TaxID=42858 RepID=A0AAP1RSQ9_MAMLE|nr:TetR/AcrR family transcriptional regulator C-terminal domain-containing protein [Mammaliicoccus lentus]MBF0842134.1 TetR/AcrR family transcriptional regulator [Mammaliicoccus lentus]MBU6114351.1 TetR family transcriptional regulator C-terminal domain-containing protein [Mammaliicoccus lentus]WHI60549.1 TetR/AcrR family transcriptional regulator C-terminal domain-containing protein [Mammaliicoccus lentus]